jgi:mRNA interferase RelE/StbE
MAYQLIILPKAEKELKKLPKKDFEKVDEAILNLAGNPRPAGCKKLQGLIDIYRVRIGDYRIVYHIKDRLLIIEVIRIANRKEAYRKLS